MVDYDTVAAVLPDIPTDIEVTEEMLRARQQAIETTRQFWEATNNMPPEDADKLRELFLQTRDGWLTSTSALQSQAAISRSVIRLLEDILQDRDAIERAIADGDTDHPAIAELRDRLADELQEELIADIHRALGGGASPVLITAVLAALRGKTIPPQMTETVIAVLAYYAQRLQETNTNG